MAKAQVLLVEDEGIIAMDIKRKLDTLGYTIMGIVSTGEEAMQIVEQQCPDLILMDINLAGEWDGVMTANRIGERFQVPVVFLTAYPDKLPMDNLVQPLGYVAKPYSWSALHATLEATLIKFKLGTLKKNKYAGTPGIPNIALN